jgi:TRAP-type C4-dicarboxylate transport system permease small subunit
LDFDTQEVIKMAGFEKTLDIVCRILSWIGGAFLLLMAGLTIFNILIRIRFSSVPGIIELVSYLFVIVVFFGIAYAGLKGDHVDVDLLVSRFPKRIQAIIACLMGLLSLGIWTLIAWQGAVYGLLQFKMGEYSPALNMQLMPFRAVMVFGCIILCLVLLLQWLKSVARAVRK